MSQFSLLKERRFGGIFWTQSIGAFTDNFFKNALALLVIYKGFNLGEADPEAAGEHVSYLASAIFIAPFFLFSATAGQLSDKLEKSGMIRKLKILEIAFSLLAVYGLWAKDVKMLLFVLFFFALQATFFGPIKYGILPQLLKEEELVGGNAMVEMSTNVFILLGTLLSSFLITRLDNPVDLGILLVAISILGFFACLFIPRTPSVSPDLEVELNPLTPTYKIIQMARETRSIWNSILGISWFFVLGAGILTALPTYTKSVLHANPDVYSVLLGLFSIGVAVGSLLCERMSHGRLEIGLVPMGSIGMSVFTFDLFLVGEPWAAPAGGQMMGITQFLSTFQGHRICLDIFLLSLFSGFFIVPLYTLIQQRARPEVRSRIIAANNIVNSLFLVFQAFGQMWLRSLGLTIPQIFGVLAILNVLVAIRIYTLVREFFLRFIAYLIDHVMYRIRIQGEHHIPEEGAAVIVSNHVTLADGLILLGAVRRPIHFVMWYTYAELPVLKYLFRDAGVIPISSNRLRPKVLERAFKMIEEALARGEVVCIFPEGALTKDGEIQKFKKGIERIIEKSPVPVVPAAMRGLWGSNFSRFPGTFWSRFKRRPLRSKIEIIFSEPIPPEQVTAELLEAKVRELRGPHP